MKNFTGVVDDPRNEDEKSKDWQHEEVVGMAAAPYVWKEFKDADIPKYTIRNQNGSGECGPFSMCKALGILIIKKIGKFVNLRPEFIYVKRTNQGPGMWMQQLFDIACKYGAPEDPTLKGDNLNEDQANSYVPTEAETKEALKYKGGKYLTISPNNIDEIARVIDLGYTPIFLLRCDVSEWTAEPYVNPKFKAPFNINHYNPGIYAGIREGVKSIVSDDSWGSSYGHNGHRILSEEFIRTRVEEIRYVIELPDDKPHYTFSTPLTYGMMNNHDVKALQDVLKYEGCLDKAVSSTGNYLNLTAQGVMKMQLKNQVAAVSEIISLKGKRVGSKTLIYLTKYK